jgi:hypothetical protein
MRISARHGSPDASTILLGRACSSAIVTNLRLLKRRPNVAKSRLVRELGEEFVAVRISGRVKEDSPMIGILP